MFYSIPDGTSLLLDCGDHPACNRGELAVPILPDQSRHAGEWIARYVERVNPNGRDVDYMMVSHFHADHTGGETWHVGKTAGRGDDYCLSGFAHRAVFTERRLRALTQLDDASQQLGLFREILRATQCGSDTPSDSGIGYSAE